MMQALLCLLVLCALSPSALSQISHHVTKLNWTKDVNVNNTLCAKEWDIAQELCYLYRTHIQYDNNWEDRYNYDKNALELQKYIQDIYEKYNDLISGKKKTNEDISVQKKKNEPKHYCCAVGCTFPELLSYCYISKVKPSRITEVEYKTEMDKHTDSIAEVFLG